MTKAKTNQVSGGTDVTPKVDKVQKAEKVAEKGQKGAKSRQKPSNNNLQTDDLTILKGKLRKKFYLLREEQLNYDNREQLLERVCVVLGMNRPNLDVILIDL